MVEKFLPNNSVTFLQKLFAVNSVFIYLFIMGLYISNIKTVQKVGNLEQ